MVNSAPKKLRRMGVFVFFAALLGATGIYQKFAKAATGVGTAVQEVISALSVVAVSNLDFGTAAQGDALKIIAPGAADNPENGSFKVSGEPGKAYTIQLPADGTVKMIVSPGNTAQTQIAVNQFKSFPATSGVIGTAGTQMLYVGGSRSAILTNQTRGKYSGTFTVVVTY